MGNVERAAEQILKTARTGGPMQALNQYENDTYLYGDALDEEIVEQARQLIKKDYPLMGQEQAYPKEQIQARANQLAKEIASAADETYPDLEQTLQAIIAHLYGLDTPIPAEHLTLASHVTILIHAATWDNTHPPLTMKEAEKLVFQATNLLMEQAHTDKDTTLISDQLLTAGIGNIPEPQAIAILSRYTRHLFTRTGAGEQERVNLRNEAEKIYRPLMPATLPDTRNWQNILDALAQGWALADPDNPTAIDLIETPGRHVANTLMATLATMHTQLQLGEMPAKNYPTVQEILEGKNADWGHNLAGAAIAAVHRQDPTLFDRVCYRLEEYPHERVIAAADMLARIHAEHAWPGKNQTRNEILEALEQYADKYTLVIPQIYAAWLEWVVDDKPMNWGNATEHEALRHLLLAAASMLPENTSEEQADEWMLLADGQIERLK